jgi:N-acetyl-beta-hexosaminidase
VQEKVDNDGNESQGKKKKKKKKKKTKDNELKGKQTVQEPKKTKQLVQFDLGDWLSTIEVQQPFAHLVFDKLAVYMYSCV